MKRSNSVILYLVLVFLSGVLVGIFAYGLYNARSVSAKANPCSPEAVRHRYTDEMKSRLSLRQDQMRELTTILDNTRGRFHALREKYHPEVQAIQDEQTDAIRKMLDSHQRAEYEKMRQEREQAHNKAQSGS